MVVYTCMVECMMRAQIRARNKYTYAGAHTHIYTNTVKVVHARRRPPHTFTVYIRIIKNK